MKITLLGSGSKGNSTLIETTNLNILIDAGLSYLNVRKRLKKELPNIDMILITHIHDDHIKGLSSFIKKYNPVIYTKSHEITEKTLYDNIYIDSFYQKEEVSIEFFPLSHDVTCHGVLIKENDKELVYITDTGFIHEKVLKKIKNKHIYILESNHDEEMLRHSKYPFYLQQRIRGDKGHLSNNMAASYMKKMIGDNTTHIVLAHLSQENNTKILADSVMNETLKEITTPLEILISSQEEAMNPIEV